MTLLISNEETAKLLTMEATIAALEASYQSLIDGTGVCRLRVDMDLPSGHPDRIYRWGTMEGGGPRYFAIRMKSDIAHWQERDGHVSREKYCVEPGRFCGLIFLFSSENGEPLAILNDGIIQQKRVGANSGIGVKHLARRDVRVVGMLGSGGMARSHMEAFVTVRPGIDRLQVFSPTAANRERFAAEMAAKHGIEAIAVDAPEKIYRDADIVAAVTDAVAPVLDGDLLAPGTHVVNIGGGGSPDRRTLERCDVYLRFGSAPGPRWHPELNLSDEHLTYAAPAALAVLERTRGAKAEKGHGTLLPEKMVSLAELASGAHPGRTSAEQITYSERGNLQGAQFWAVASVVYEAARKHGLGRELPTEWFLQDIRN